MPPLSNVLFWLPATKSNTWISNPFACGIEGLPYYQLHLICWTVMLLPTLRDCEEKKQNWRSWGWRTFPQYVWWPNLRNMQHPANARKMALHSLTALSSLYKMKCCTKLPSLKLHHTTIIRFAFDDSSSLFPSIRLVTERRRSRYGWEEQVDILWYQLCRVNTGVSGEYSLVLSDNGEATTF